jgi:hypothetical protein
MNIGHKMNISLGGSMDIKIEGKGCTKQLIKMLAWIQLLGSVGHTANFKVIVDGDGCTRWKFKFEDKELQELFDKYKSEMLENNINTHKDIKYFEL